MTSRAKGWKAGQPVRFIRGHAMRAHRRPLESRWDVDDNGCWIWNGAISKWGYGIYTPEDLVTWRAHRYVYTQLVGPIPEGLALDHLCEVKACVNPAHLDPCTSGENSRRHVQRRKAAA